MVFLLMDLDCSSLPSELLHPEQTIDACSQTPFHIIPHLGKPTRSLETALSPLKYGILLLQRSQRIRNCCVILDEPSGTARQSDESSKVPHGRPSAVEIAADRSAPFHLDYVEVGQIRPPQLQIVVANAFLYRRNSISDLDLMTTVFPSASV